MITATARPACPRDPVAVDDHHSHTPDAYPANLTVGGDHHRNRRGSFLGVPVGRIRPNIDALFRARGPFNAPQGRASILRSVPFPWAGVSGLPRVRGRFWARVSQNAGNRVTRHMSENQRFAAIRSDLLRSPLHPTGMPAPPAANTVDSRVGRNLSRPGEQSIAPGVHRGTAECIMC